MKRFLSVLLSVLLIVTLICPVLAEGDEGSVQTSRLTGSALYREWRHLFTECEKGGMDSVLTRAGVFQSLYLLSGDKVAEDTSVFFDVDSGAWYAEASAWSKGTGLYTGDGSGYFYPDGAVTRESLCLILKGFASCMGWSIPSINEWFPFCDGGTFYSAPARDAAAMMQQGGILIEDETGCFYPGSTLTVSEWESILLRFIYAGDPESLFPALPVSTVKEGDPVEDGWFDDVCFIGHSQVVGMQKYFNLPGADYFCVIGHTAKAVLDYEDYELPQGGMGTLRQGLQGNSYGKVYVMLGINDCSDREDRIREFMEPMRKILDMVKETQPEAVIYLISVLPVGSYNTNPYIYNPENTILYSQAIKTLSREYGAEYLDMFRLMADSEGYILDEYNAGDGIHIQPAMYEPIKDFLKTHTGGH